MKGWEWRVMRANGLKSAHNVIYEAFNRQLEWWVYIPVIGIPRIFRRQKLLRIGQYLVDQITDLRENHFKG